MRPQRSSQSELDADPNGPIWQCGTETQATQFRNPERALQRRRHDRFQPLRLDRFDQRALGRQQLGNETLHGPWFSQPRFQAAPIQAASSRFPNSASSNCFASS